MSNAEPIKMIIVRRHSNGEMMVELSTHLRFVEGTRFDLGFMNIAMSEGYIIQIYPDKKRSKLSQIERGKLSEDAW